MTERNGVLARSKPLAPRIAKRRATARVAASQRLLAMATLVSFMASLLAGRPARAETLPGATDPIGNGAGGVETLATPLPAANATSELATVDLATGAARSSFPFKLETARGGAQPSLALAYSSSNGVGFAGSGWTLTTPSIVRRGSAGMPQFQDVVLTSPASLVRNKLADEYLMDGQLLVPICSVDGAACGGGESQIPLSSLLANTTREVLPSQVGGVSVDGWAYFRREIDDGRRYFFSPDGRTWIVQDKRGNSQQFGHPLDAFRFGTDGIEVADGGAQVQLGVGPVPYRWNLVRESDASGNTVYYVWANLREASGIVTPVFDNGVRYLTDIYDTESYAFQPCKNGVCPAPRPLHDFAHHVHLRWDARTSTLSRAGVATSPIWRALPALLLTGVDVTSATLTSRARQLVRRYHLGYQLSSDWATLDELASITLEGACTDTGGIVSMPEDGNGLLSLFTECSTLGGATPTLRFAYAPDAPRQDGLPILTVKQKFPYNVPTFDRGAGCGPWAPSPLCGGFSMADVNGDAVADYVYGPLSAEKGNDCHGDIDCAEGQQCLLNNPPFNFSGTCTSPGTPKVFFPGDDIYVDYGPPPASSAGAVAEAPYRLFSGPGFARQAHELQLGPMGTVRPQGASEKTFDRRVFADWLSHGHVDWMWLNLDLEGNRVPGAFEIYTPSQASDGSGTFPLSLDTISTLAHFPTTPDLQGGRAIDLDGDTLPDQAFVPLDGQRFAADGYLSRRDRSGRSLPFDQKVNGGSFATANPAEFPGFVSRSFADMDGDGLAEVVVATASAGQLSLNVATGRGNGSFGSDLDGESHGRYVLAAGPIDSIDVAGFPIMTLGDLNGDGLGDFALINRVHLQVCLRTLTGTSDFSCSTVDTASLGWPGDGSPNFLTIADIDGSGLPELLVWGKTPGPFGILTVVSVGAFAPGATGRPGLLQTVSSYTGAFTHVTYGNWNDLLFEAQPRAAFSRQSVAASLGCDANGDRQWFDRQPSARA